MQDSTGYYAFVEFEDALGVQNALKVSCYSNGILYAFMARLLLYISTT